MSPIPLRRRLGRGGLSLLVAATGTTLLLAGPAQTAAASSGPSCADDSCTATFAATGAAQTFLVPPGVTSVTATVAGASGGTPGGSLTPPAGAGGSSTGTFAVSPGDQLTVVVGQAGSLAADDFGGGSGGYGGGGRGGNSGGGTLHGGPGAGGGGGSFLFDGAELLLVGGGGGAGSGAQAGGAGGAAGADAGRGATGSFGAGGEPGTLDGNGAGGSSAALFAQGGPGQGTDVTPDVQPTGGFGGNGYVNHSPVDGRYAGGGGGGGFRAGGGGSGPYSGWFDDPSTGSGGGGGAGFAAATATAVSGEAGVRLGDGEVVLTYAYVPRIDITSQPPAHATVGDPAYTVSADGAVSNPNPVTFSAGNDSSCSVVGDVVSFDHAGTCIVLADQAGDEHHPAVSTQQSFAVAKQAQVITFALPAEPQHVGDVVPLQATGGASGQPVTFALGEGTPSEVCTLDGTTLTLTGAGTCVVRATQDGDADHEAATPVQQHVDVDRVTTRTTLTFDEDQPVYGQPVTATAHVEGTTSGTVQVLVDGQPVDEPVTLDPTTGTLAQTLPSDLLGAGGREITAVFSPADTVTYAGSQADRTLAVGQALTRTDVSLRADQASVLVSAVAPGRGTPEGDVVFTVGSDTYPVVALHHGKASLPVPVPDGATVGVRYLGDDDFAASSDSTLRTDPTITATLTSAQSVSPSGWYRTPVTVTFNCSAGSAPLTGDGCPDPVTLSKDGAAQGVSRTVLAQDGGLATASVSGIDIDQTKPVVAPFGVVEGSRFFATAPEASCLATDELSGVYGCAAARVVKGSKVTYRVIAADQARNLATLEVHASTYRYGIVDAPYADGVYTVKKGQTYTLVAKSSRHARLLKITSTSKKPSKKGPRFVSTGRGTWALGYHMGPSLKVGKTYRLGIATDKRHLVTIRVVA